MQYFGILIALTIAFYTFLFGLEIRRQKNYWGFWAMAILAFIAFAMPFYILFLR